MRVLLIIALSLLPALPDWLSLEENRVAQNDIVKQCQLCHQEQSWKPLRESPEFDHDKTLFPLSGSHASLACSACHNGSTWDEIHSFSELPVDCWGCHADVHHGALGDDCEQCHRTDSWSMLRAAEIHESLNFPLVGVHRTLACEACHVNAASHRFDGVSNECVVCHQTDFTRALDTVPGHTHSTSCEVCHHPAGWDREGIFAHVAFPIRSGRHAFECDACHPNGNTDDFSCSITCHFSGCTEFHDIDAHASVGCPEPAQHECAECHPKGRSF